MIRQAAGFAGLPLRKGKGGAFRRAAMWLLLLLFAAVALIPFLWMLSSSLKLERDIFRYPMEWIPLHPQWDNYVVIWQKVPLHIYMKNTAVVSVAVTFMQILTSTFAAYAFAKMNFRGRDALFLAYIATIAVPWQVYMLPQFIMMRAAGLYDTLWSLIILQSFSAFGVFLMRQFYLGIPNELSEAARIDGLSEYGIWWRIIMPLAKPAVVTLLIFTFVNTWNDYMGPLIYLTTDSVKTVQIGLKRFIQQYSNEYTLIIAASLVSLVPVTVAFLSLQRYFIEGIATTGLKG